MTCQMHVRSTRWLILSFLAFAAYCGFIVARNYTGELHTLGPDSYQYLSFAEHIAAGSEQHFGSGINHGWWGSFTRAPGYSIFLSPGLFLFSLDAEKGLRLMHILLGIFTCAFFVYHAAAYLNPLAAIALFAGLTYHLEFRINTIGLEWPVICLQLILYSLLIREPGRGRSSVLSLGLVAGLLTLFRPDFAVAYAAVFLFAVVSKVPFNKCVLLLVASFMPCVVWMGANWLRFGSFSLSGAMSAVTSFGLASVLGTAPAASNDTAEVLNFLEYVNAHLRPLSCTELCRAYDLGPMLSSSSQSEALFSNLEVPTQYSDARNWGPFQKIPMMALFTERSLESHKQCYARHFLCASKALLYNWYLLLPAFFLPLLWLKQGRYRGPAAGALLVLLIHALHVCAVALVHPVTERYFISTYYPFFFAGAYNVMLEITSRFRIQLRDGGADAPRL